MSCICHLLCILLTQPSLSNTSIYFSKNLISSNESYLKITHKETNTKQLTWNHIHHYCFHRYCHYCRWYYKRPVSMGPQELMKTVSLLRYNCQL